MAATFSTKITKVPASFFKRSGQLVGGAAAEYFESAMPISTSIIKESTTTFSSVTKTLTNTSQSILPQLKGIKLQTGLRSVMSWFNGADDTFGDSSDFDADLTFDTETTSGEETKAQLSELENVSNNISKAVIESDKHLLEGNMQLTANIVTSIDKQTAVISAGFDRTNDTLGKILEVMTKNTATLIEMEKANSSNDNMVSNGKFNLNEYKKIIQGNISKNPSLGMISAFLPMLTDKNMIKMMTTPESVVSMMFEGVLNKKSPNLKKNMQALDEAINDTIMNSLIRLGEKKNNSILSMFGVSSDRKDYSKNSRSTLEVKAVPFDSITKESITQAIPGYLRKILVQLGGEDVIYDNRSRSWRKGSAIKKDFIKETARTGGIYSASSRIKESFGNEQLGSMIYDLMMTDIGSKQGQHDARRNQSMARTQIDLFSDPKKFVEYVNKELYKARNKDEERYIEAIGKRLSMNGRNLIDISNNVARNNVQRTRRVDSYLSEADKYGIDVSKLSSSLADEMNHILEENGVVKAEVSMKSSPVSGVEYSNRALYEIYRLLDRGINVFQTGSSNIRSKPYKRYNETYLKAPVSYKSKQLPPDSNEGLNKLVSSGSTFADDTDNLLRNNTLEDSTQENLTKDERLGRWGKSKGSDLFKAMFSGSPEQVKEVFGSAVSDFTGIMRDAVKEQAGKINDSFGNVTSYMRHKLFGTEYQYTDENGQEIKVKGNDKGGMLGFVQDYFKDRLKVAQTSASKWFGSVRGYFDNGDPKESDDVKKKRKSLLTASVGAFAGAGILGGPLGLIVGGLAGSALSNVDIGSKIKDLLFGDGKDGKKKGLVRGAFDSVIDPIRYQVHKSMNTFKAVIKNKVLGPIADLGTAIKDRMGNIMDKTFGNAFRFIGKVIMAPFKIKGIARKIFAQVVGTGARGAARAGGTVFEAGTNALSSLIAGNSMHTYIDENGEKQTMKTKDWMKQNRKNRKSSYKNEIQYDDYKTWKSNEDARRAEWMSKLHDYLKEDTEVISGIEEHTSETSDDVHELLRLGSEQGSIFTHDQGIHDRLDTIIDAIHGIGNIRERDDIIDLDESQYTIDGVTGAKISIEEKEARDHINESNSDDADAFANSALAAGATIITEGNITNKDKMTFSKLWKEAGKRGSSREVVGSMLNTLLNGQEDDLIEQRDKTSSWWETLLDKVKDFAPAIAGVATAIAGVATILGNIDLSTINEALSNIRDALGNGIKLLFGGGDDDPTTDDDGVTGAVNAVGGFVDTKVENAWDLTNPLATINHRGNDAAGNAIKNKSVTEDKQWLQLGLPVVNSIRKSSLYNNELNNYNNTKNTLKTTYKNLREQGYTPSQIRYNKDYQTAKENYNNAKTNVAEAKEKSSVTKNVGSGITHNIAKMGIGQLIARGVGKVVGGVAGNIAEDVTGSEETADQVQQYAEYTGTALTSTAIIKNEVKSAAKGKTSAIDFVLGQLKRFCDFLAEHFKSVKKLQGVMSKITSFIDDLYNKSVGKVTNAVATKIANRVAKITGKQVTTTTVAAATFGLSIAAGALSGAISGYCSTENLFNVPPGSADALMKTISTLLKGLFSALEWTPGLGVFVSVFDLFDDLIFRGILGTSLKQYLAEYLYELLGDKSKLEDLQGKMASSKAEYEETYSTTLNDSAWNDLVNNSGLFDVILHGKAKTNEDGTIDIDATFNEDGSRKEGGLVGLGQSIKQGVSDIGDSISSAFTYVKDNISEFPSSVLTYIKGETDEVEFNIDENNPGQPIVSIIGKVLTFVTSPAHSIVSIGKKIGDLFSTTVDFGSALVSKVKSYLKGDTDSISLGINKDSIYYYILSPISSIMQYVLSPIRFVAKTFGGISDIVKIITGGDSTTSNNSSTNSSNKPSTITEKISSLWDRLTGKGSGGSTNTITMPPINNGTIELPSLTSLIYSFGSGGPLSKDAVVTSNYGNRKYPFAGKHEGVDLSPADGTGKADVQSNVIGTVSYVKNNVPNSDTAKLGSGGWSYEGSNSGGNMVWIDTPDGYRVKNMHLKAGSIPSNLRRGSVVSVGDKIGEVGSTGWSTGQHLHYQVEKDGAAVNPMYGTGGFMDAINSLVSTGSQILTKITGGIFSTSSSSSSDSTLSSTDSSNVSVVQIALNEVGTAETGENNVKYNTWFYGHEVNGGSYPWCMAFVQWCFDQAGIPFDYKVASVMAFYNYYKGTNKSMVVQPTDTIQPGDVMIKQRSGGGHTGIVVQDNGDGTVTTVEGNTSPSKGSGSSEWNGGCVAVKTQKKSDILAFIRNPKTVSTVTSTSGNTTLSAGETRVVPVEGLGKAKPYMGWQCITSKTSEQYKLREQAGQNFDSNGFGVINGRYVIAMKPYWGNVGDYVDVKLDNGTTIQGIIGDIKADENAGVSFSQYAHGTTKENSSVVEFVVNKDTWYNSGRSVVGFHPEFNSTVESVTNRGSYWGTGGGKSSINVPFIYSKNRGIGGSSFGNNKYSTKNVKPSTRSSYGAGGHVSYAQYNTPFVTTSYGTSGDNSSSTDLSKVVTLMAQVVSELIQISNNTHTSSNYLSSINDKDFVDSGLRNSIKAINKSKASKSSNTTSNSRSSAKSVAKLASP